MKREIKFRVWDSITKMLHQWWRVKKIGISMFDLDHYILLQYTGLKDKNRIEIYEGDIMSFGRKQKYHVVFESGSFILYHTVLKDFDGSKLRWGLLSRAFDVDMKGIIDNVKVVGNIYENPELIKPKSTDD